jgi:hypothetical protein
LLIQEGNLESLYYSILGAAMSLMSSDMSSMQLFDPERNQLHLLAWKGFHPQSAVFWEWVSFDSDSVCGLALSAGCRVVMQDIETCVSIASTPDLDEFRRSNIRAVQSTPVVSRSGQLLGMISTHWREPHQPAARDLRRLDVLARQAADLIERGKTEAALRERTPLLTSLPDGEMSRLIREKDWSRTPIGPVEQWSATLKTMVDFLLANRFPLLLWWGPQYVSIYNDSYRPILGAKHPRAVGQPFREVWPEIEHILSPLIDTPFNGGAATWMVTDTLRRPTSRLPTAQFRTTRLLVELAASLRRSTRSLKRLWASAGSRRCETSERAQLKADQRRKRVVWRRLR